MNEQLLKDYAAELGVGVFGLSLGDLINSHRTLRQANLRSHDECRAELERGYAFGVKQGLEDVKNGQYIETAALRGMTIGELVDMLQE